jgi:hypothetical protein
MFTLDAVVPWGRSFDEYCAMFALSDRDLGLRILDCGGGPASFNAEGTRGGRCIVSCDPIYRFTASQIETRIAATYAAIIDQTRHNASEFVWTSMRSVDELGAVRMAAMRKFLDDYPAEQFDESFHCSSIAEMGRVADEVRIFPLLALGSVPSFHVDPVAADMRRRGFAVSIENVPYEFQKGGNQMMRIRRSDAAGESAAC